MPLGYHTGGYDRDENREKAEPGEYAFKVEDANEVRFKTGNEGLELRLLVAALPNRDITVFDRLVYVDKARWKIDKFLASIGFDFFSPPELHDLYGKQGMASFVTGEKGYLEVEEYFPKDASDASRPTSRQSVPYGDDLPF